MILVTYAVDPGSSKLFFSAQIPITVVIQLHNADATKSVGEKARGQAVTKSVTPGQQVIKIVHDELIKVLEGNSETSNALKIDNPPATILMVGLQGSGKTTSAAKLAKNIEKNYKKK